MATLAFAILLLSTAVAGADFQVNTQTAYGQKNPDIVVDSDGGFVVVWSGYSLESGYTSMILGQRYDSSGATLGTEFQVSDANTSLDRYPSVATGSDGGFVVVWDGPAGLSYQEILAQRFDADGSKLGTNFVVNTYTTLAQRFPEVISDGARNYVIVWTGFSGQDGDGAGVFGQRIESSGATVGTEFLVNSTTLGYQTEATLDAEGGSGGFVVAWEGNPGSGLFARRFDGGGAPLAPEFQVTNGFVSGAVAGVEAGGFVTVWQGTEGVADIFGQRYDATGAPVGPEFQVTNNGGGNLVSEVGFPRHSVNAFSIDSDSAGSFVVVWDGSELYGRKFDAAAQPLGGEFRVNSYTTSSQSFPVVGADDQGNFVVAWSSFGQDGDAYGVFAQRFLSTALVCPAVPQSAAQCFAALRSQMQMSAKGGSRDRLKWKWQKGDEIDVLALGDPVAVTSHAFCIYEDDVLIKTMTANPGGSCGGKPCWKAAGGSGFKYQDKDLDPGGSNGGLFKLQTRAGDAGKSRAQVQGKGGGLSLQSVLPIGASSTVVAQLINSDGACWTSEFASAVASKNDENQYKAKN